MKPPRRLVLTLTPLLDLMLVVIFAQYMDLQQASAARVRAERLRAEDATRARSDMEKARESAFQSLKKRNEDLAALREKSQTLVNENSRLREELAVLSERHKKELEEERRKAREQILAIARGFQEVLDVPNEVMEKALEGSTPEEIRDMQRDVAELRGKSLPAIVKHLRKAAEFRKLWDVWEVHINPDESTRIMVGDKVVRDGLFVKSKDDFFVQTEALFKDTGEPKSFVLVLVSYGDVTRSARDGVMGGLELTKEKLRNHWSSEKQIQVAKLGFIPQAP